MKKIKTLHGDDAGALIEFFQRARKEAGLSWCDRCHALAKLRDWDGKRICPGCDSRTHDWSWSVIHPSLPWERKGPGRCLYCGMLYQGWNKTGGCEFGSRG